MNLFLATGRRISLSHIEQWRTYAGVLCGRPTRERDNEKLQELLRLAREQSNLSSAVLIPPPDGERLPVVCCVATFDSGELDRPGSEPYSSLGVAWLQEEFALPIDQRVIELMRQMDWEELAVDWCW